MIYYYNVIYYTYANPTDKTISLPFFSPVGGGVWGGAEQKIEKEMVFGGRSPEVRGRWRGGVVRSRPAGRERKHAKRSASYSGFSSKKVRISTKRYRQFAILSVLAELRAEQSSAEVALRAKRADFATICHALRGEKEMFWFWIWKFFLAKPKQSFTTNLFLFRLWRNLEAII